MGGGLGSPSANACGAGGTRPEVLDLIVAEGTKVAEKATMADGCQLRGSREQWEERERERDRTDLGVRTRSPEGGR